MKKMLTLIFAGIVALGMMAQEPAKPAPPQTPPPGSSDVDKVKPADKPQPPPAKSRRRSERVKGEAAPKPAPLPPANPDPAK